MRTRFSHVKLALLALGGVSSGCAADGPNDVDIGHASPLIADPGCGGLDASAPPPADGAMAMPEADAGADAGVTEKQPLIASDDFIRVGNGCSTADTKLALSADGTRLEVQFGRFSARRLADLSSELSTCLMSFPLTNGAKTFALERIEAQGTTDLPVGVRGEVLLAPAFQGRGGLTVKGTPVDKRITFDGAKNGAFSSVVTLEEPEVQFIPCQADVTRRAQLTVNLLVQEVDGSVPSAATVQLDALRLQYRVRDCSASAAVSNSKR